MDLTIIKILFLGGKMSKYNFDRVIDRVGTDCVNGILELIVQQKHKRWFAFFGLLIWILNVQNQ